MKKGIYTGDAVTYHQKFGELVPGKEYDVPDTWDFMHETLFVPAVEAAMREVGHADNVERMPPVKSRSRN